MRGFGSCARPSFRLREQAKRTALWEQLKRYKMSEKLVLAEKIRKFVFASRVARRIKVGLIGPCRLNEAVRMRA